MGFWKNVDDELKYQGMERKVLASLADFDVSYIGKGIRRNSIPAADLALRISKALNVSLEYLLEIPESDSISNQQISTESNTAMHFFHKYSDFFTELETLSPKEKDLILSLIKTLNAAHQ